MKQESDRPKGLILEDLPEGGGEAGALEDHVFGSWLRSQREMRSISLREIADATKISFRYLEALEDERFDLLPAPVFARGFLQQYARYVGLDPDEVVNFFLSAQKAESDPEEQAPPSRESAANNWTTGVILAILVTAFLAIVFVLSFRAQQQESAAEPPPIVAPTPEPSSPPPPPEEVITEPEPEAESGRSAPLVLVLDFLQDCWVEARTDGGPPVSQYYVQGESLRLEGEASLSLTLGRADGVRAELNGHPLAIETGSGSEVAHIEIDLATALALEEEGPAP